MDKLKGYVFRIDDITAGMNWNNFEKIEKIFDKYGVKAIIGVVPDNMDPTLNAYDKIDDFWGKIKKLIDKGWIVAQHGFQHKYITDNGGILGINNYSEFSGLSYKEQYEKIKKGKQILENNLGITIKWWMAPAHSFDEITCKVLKDLGFEYITDGIGLYPFEKYSLKWLPQQIWKPIKMPLGIWTICLHINNYNDRFIEKIENFCKNNNKYIINNLENLIYKNNLIKNILNYLSKIIFYILLKLHKFISTFRLLVQKKKELENYGGFIGFLKGFWGAFRNFILQKIYGFDRWHIYPIEWRPYAQFIYKYINKHTKGGLVLEIACGLGEILKNIKNTNKEGWDIKEDVIKGAKLISKDIKYYIGSFDDIKGKKIEFLITVGFTHGIDKEDLIKYYDNITKNNDIEYIIVDELPGFHKLVEIIPKTYNLIDISETFKSGRKVLVFKKI